MAYDINDWETTTLEKIKFSPTTQDNQRIKSTVNELDTIEVVKVGLNYLATKLGYYDGTNFIHYFSSDGDAQLRWNNISHQVVKDTKYEVNMDRVNGVVEIDFNLILSSADNPSFSIYDESNILIGTLNLINVGNTNSVTGFCKFVNLENGYNINAVYTYVKNTTSYSENQSIFIETKPKYVSFGTDGAITYTSQSYVKITNK